MWWILTSIWRTPDWESFHVTLHEIYSNTSSIKQSCLAFLPLSSTSKNRIIFKKWFTAIISNCSSQKASRTPQFLTYFQPPLLGECCWKGDWAVAADGHGWNELSRFIPVGLDMALRQFWPRLWSKLISFGVELEKSSLKSSTTRTCWALAFDFIIICSKSKGIVQTDSLYN